MSHPRPSPRSHRPKIRPAASRALAALFSLGVLLACLAPAAGAQAPARVIPVGEAAYVTSGAWSPFGLLLFDAAGNRLVRVEEDGSLSELRRLDGVPTSLAALSDAGDLLVQWRNPDAWVTVRTTATDWSVRDRWTCEGCSLGTWTPLHGRRVLAVGEVTGSEGTEGSAPAGANGGGPGGEGGEVAGSPTSRAGIFWVTPRGPELVHPLREDDLPLYLYGLRWVATAGRRGFAIVPEPSELGASPAGLPHRVRRLQILELTPNQRSSRVLARLPAPRPGLSFPTLDDMGGQMSDLSELHLPLALVGWEDRLYLLQKSTQGLEVWRVDTDDGGLHFLQVLPPSDFVTVVPGSEHWALVQKGPVTGFGQQTVRAVLLVPSDRFR